MALAADNSPISQKISHANPAFDGANEQLVPKFDDQSPTIVLHEPFISTEYSKLLRLAIIPKEREALALAETRGGGDVSAIS